MIVFYICSNNVVDFQRIVQSILQTVMIHHDPSLAQTKSFRDHKETDLEACSEFFPFKYRKGRIMASEQTKQTAQGD